jgi:hypothetical protein
MRAIGWYWCKRDLSYWLPSSTVDPTQWVPMYWDGKEWSDTLEGENEWSESEFLAIGERLVPPNEGKEAK